MPVHPRVRGEHVLTGRGGQTYSGSSPRARGTPTRPTPTSTAWRFIPACAGNTGLGLRLGRQPAVHPRVRGEHVAQPAVHRGLGGSSPRARGTLSSSATDRIFQRFIPACAGNTAILSAACTDEPVHPRVRGEHSQFVCSGQARHGSSPRARGTPAAGRGPGEGERFIPACAGNTCTRPTTRRPRTVHPRVRGEHAHDDLCAAKIRGSSPRARGTRPGTSGRGRQRRFIPACAGNTPSPPAIRPRTPVHPRVRGEHNCARNCVTASLGSSPRARGTRCGGTHSNGERRFIPACAGNT